VHCQQFNGKADRRIEIMPSVPGIFILRAFVRTWRKTIFVSDKLNPVTWERITLAGLILLTGSICGLINVTSTPSPAGHDISTPQDGLETEQQRLQAEVDWENPKFERELRVSRLTDQTAPRNLVAPADSGAEFSDISWEDTGKYYSSRTDWLADLSRKTRLESMPADAKHTGPPDTMARLRLAEVRNAEAGLSRSYQRLQSTELNSELKIDRGSLSSVIGRTKPSGQGDYLMVLSACSVESTRSDMVGSKGIRSDTSSRWRSGAPSFHNRAMASERFVFDQDRARPAAIQVEARHPNAPRENFPGFKPEDKTQIEEAIRRALAGAITAAERSANPADREPGDKNSEILFWLFLSSTIVNLLGTISTIVLAWVSNNRAKAELLLRQAEARLKTKETELRIKELEVQVARAAGELTRSSSVIVLAN
jgi:hypothetical protein